MAFLLGKLALSCFFVACSAVVALRRERLRAFAARLPDPALVCLIYLAARVLALWILHKHLGVSVPSDVPGYFEHAVRILGGEVPNREFSSPYGFLFNYLMAAAVFLYRDPFSILVMLQLGECLGLYLLMRALTQHTGDARNSGLLFLIYATNPVIGVNLWLGGEDESLLILVLGSAALLATSARAALVMTLPGLLFSASKLFAAWILVPLALARNWRDRFGMAIGLAGVLGFIKLTGATLISFEFSRPQGSGDQLSTMQTSGNLWYVVTKILDLQVPGYLPQAIALASLAVCGAWLWSQSRRLSPLLLVLAGTALFGLCFQVTYRMTAPPYLAPAIAALAMVLVMQRASTVALALWSGLWSYDGTFWYRVRDVLPQSPLLRTVFDLFEILLVSTTIVAFVWTLSWARSAGTHVQVASAGADVDAVVGADVRDKIAFK